MYNPNARSPYRFVLVQFPALLGSVICAAVFVCWVFEAAEKWEHGVSQNDPMYALMWGVSLLASYSCFSLFRVLWRESK